MNAYDAFVAMVVEGDPYHMVFVIKGSDGAIERKWPLMQFQDKERTKPVNFLPKFADSQVVI